MDTFSKYLDFFHLPFFNSPATPAKAATSAGKVLDTTKSIADTASKSLSSLHMLSLTPGQLFVVLIVVGVLLLALTLGRTRTLVSALAIYVAFSLEAVFPFFGWLLKNQSFTNDLPTLRVLVFFVLYGIVFALLNRSILKTRFNLGEASFLGVVLMGIAQLGFIISIIVNLAPKFYNIGSRLPAIVVPYVASPQALFWWALVPVVLVVFAKRQHDD